MSDECPHPMCEAATWYGGMDSVGRIINVCPVHGAYAVNGGGRR